MRLAAEAKRIEVEASVAPELQPIVCDPNRVQQIIHNLLNNAVKFTPEGGRVVVSVRQSAQSVRITVMDNGQGIAPAFLPHVFNHFRQEDQSKNRHHGGLGLGLSIVKHLVELHGGTVQADSEGEDRGATFTVSLPLRASDLSSEAVVSVPRRPEISLTPIATTTSAVPVDMLLDALAIMGGRKVLVVDDDECNCEPVARILKESGVIVRTATSGHAGLNLVAEFDPDLVISDIGMPGMNGYEFVRQIRNLGTVSQSVPCIALTAYARPEDRDEAMKAGFNEHMSKPFDTIQFVQAVSRLRRSFRMITEGPATAGRELQPNPRSRVSCHILLAEDNKMIAEMIQAALFQAGYRVSVAETIAQGLAIADDSRVDILLSDLHLKDGMGWDLLARLQAERRIPAIAMSGYADEAYVSKCKAAGFSEYMVKPVDTDELIRAVSRLLARTTGPE